MEQHFKNKIKVYKIHRYTSNLCSVYPEESMKQSFQGIRGYIFVTDTLKFAYFLNLMFNVLLEIITKFFNRRCVYFVC
jgi:hypothetical protein